MKKLIKALFILASIGSLAFVPWILVKAWILPLPDTVQEQLDQGIDNGMNGIILYVDEAGKSPEFYAAGYKNRESKTPANPHDLFKIASISKLFLAVSVAQLVDENRLSLDKALTEYLPDLPGKIANADQITLRMLVQHRSGIPNFTDTPGYWANPSKSTQESLEMIVDKPADFAPGEKYSYSNSNYVLIGEILDKTLGYNHRQFIRENILDPLNLKNTYFLLNEVDTDLVMSGYDAGWDGDFKLADFINPSGSMIASAEDVGIFLRALNDGSLLNDNAQAIYSSIYEYGHTGLLPGYSSIARYHQDMDAVVILFVSNSGGYSWNLTELLYSRILKILRKE